MAKKKQPLSLKAHETERASRAPLTGGAA